MTALVTHAKREAYRHVLQFWYVSSLRKGVEFEERFLPGQSVLKFGGMIYIVLSKNGSINPKIGYHIQT